MSATDMIALRVINIVGGHDIPLSLKPLFGQYDRPIAEAVKFPADSYRVESIGWDAAARDIVYVLFDRFQGSQSMIVIKQSKLLPPVLRRGASIRLFSGYLQQRSSRQEEKVPLKKINLEGELSSELVKVVGVRAVKTMNDKRHARDFEYIYELESETGTVVKVPEPKMQELVETYKAMEKMYGHEKVKKESDHGDNEGSPEHVMDSIERSSVER